jgi:hypothetical protein
MKQIVDGKINDIHIVENAVHDYIDLGYTINYEHVREVWCGCGEHVGTDKFSMSDFISKLDEIPDELIKMLIRNNYLMKNNEIFLRDLVENCHCGKLFNWECTFRPDKYDYVCSLIMSELFDSELIKKYESKYHDNILMGLMRHQFTHKIFDVIKYLESLGFNFNTPNDRGKNVLNKAIDHGDEELIQKFIDLKVPFITSNLEIVNPVAKKGNKYKDIIHTVSCLQCQSMFATTFNMECILFGDFVSGYVGDPKELTLYERYVNLEKNLISCKNTILKTLHIIQFCIDHGYPKQVADSEGKTLKDYVRICRGYGVKVLGGAYDELTRDF